MGEGQFASLDPAMSVATIIEVPSGFTDPELATSTEVTGRFAPSVRLSPEREVSND
jgi:hypothetical protein